jgi:Na+-translocating ferredoxin:NAD+ oxidoreductase RnfD subunit
MPSTATGIVLTAGTITFANEWYQTHQLNLRVPVATLLAAAIFDGLAHIDNKAAVSLSVIVLLGAVTTRFNGESAADTLAKLFSATTGKQSKKTTVRVA